MKPKLTITKSKKENFLIIFLIGILILVILWPTNPKSGKNNMNKSGLSDMLNGNIKTNQIDTSISSEQIPQTENQSLEYTDQLEDMLEDLLSTMEGAGKVHAMVTLKTSADQIVEKDEESTVYIRDDELPFVRQVIYPTVQGVVISAEGAGNASVRKNITEAVQVLFGIDVHKIKIIKMKRD